MSKTSASLPFKIEAKGMGRLVAEVLETEFARALLKSKEGRELMKAASEIPPYKRT